MSLQSPQSVVEACPIVFGLFPELKLVREDLIVPKTHHPQKLNECEQRKQCVAAKHWSAAGGNGVVVCVKAMVAHVGSPISNCNWAAIE